MTIFKSGHFRLHSGSLSKWKIDLDELSAEDLGTLAMLGARLVGPFGMVEGVPRGGKRLAEAMAPYCVPSGPLLVVDDVLTTGTSMEARRPGLTLASTSASPVRTRRPSSRIRKSRPVVMSRPGDTSSSGSTRTLRAAAPRTGRASMSYSMTLALGM